MLKDHVFRFHDIQPEAPEGSLLIALNLLPFITIELVLIQKIFEFLKKKRFNSSQLCIFPI